MMHSGGRHIIHVYMRCENPNADYIFGQDGIHRRPVFKGASKHLLSLKPLRTTPTLGNKLLGIRVSLFLQLEKVKIHYGSSSVRGSQSSGRTAVSC